MCGALYSMNRESEDRHSRNAEKPSTKEVWFTFDLENSIGVLGGHYRKWDDKLLAE